jgi:hypothetical protein
MMAEDLHHQVAPCHMLLATCRQQVTINHHLDVILFGGE